MKVAFDEHVPIALAKVFLALAKERPIRRASEGLIFEKAEDYAPKSGEKDYIKKSDVPWLDRFAAAGGHAIISGDTKMRQNAHERLALYQHGFVVIFFEAQWGAWNFFRKSALMLHWWKEITDKIRSAEKATFWAVPAAWPIKVGEPGELRNVSLGLAQLLKDKPQPDARPTRRKRRDAAQPAKPTDSRQTAMFGMMESGNVGDEKGCEETKRFIETARQLECEEDQERFEKKLGKIAKVKPAQKVKPSA